MLEQVCVGQNEVILRFDSDVEVMLTSDMRLTSAAGEEHVSQIAPRSGCLLVALLGRSVENAEPLPPGTLKLIWSSGEILELFDSFSSYESYTVRTGDRLIVV